MEQAVGLQQPLSLDRMAIEEAGPNPERLAQAVHLQLGAVTKAIPVYEIAHALDISEIRFEKLQSFEGALLTTPERDIGSILVNEDSQAERRRFTIAHELGHYLNPWHKPMNEAGFMCGKTDLRIGQFIVKPGLTVHERQELQANQFAIELLAPRKSIESWTSDHASLQEALSIGSRLELSKSAATRRYVELHHMPVDVVYTRYGRVRYHIRSRSCPRLRLGKGNTFTRPHSIGRDKIHEHEIDVAVQRGAEPATETTAYAETLFQQDGYAITLLVFENQDDD